MKVRAPSHVQFGKKLIDVPTKYGLAPVGELSDEIKEYFDILLGRKDSPVNSPYLSLQEVATGYFARALEIEALIHEGEREGDIAKGSDYYRFRTGMLRSFIDAAKRAAELGSRRLSQETLLAAQRHDAGEA